MQPGPAQPDPAQLGAAQTEAAPQDGAAPDFHAIWEARCLACHGHAGPFVRERLTFDHDEIHGREGREIGPFLERHGGGLEPDQIALFLRVFARQLASGGFYERECRICHDSARDLARLRLVLRDGRLMGRYSDREIAPFLATHARMTPPEAEAMTEALTAILQGAR
ncbi:MAG: hypothetical protein RQ752_05205 [Thermohalobaculum sp.]|nr:hypothetical protein [Thermohalobaculum sp.]